MTDGSRDYTRSRAVLFGTAAYTHLTPVPAALNSLTRMKAVLTGDLCGWPEDRVSVFADQRRPGDLSDQLVQLFHDAEDVALFYYVGHGQVDPSDTLCLGLVESTTEPSRRKPTSLPFDAVRHALTHSRAKTKIVILDCCYAGLAAPGGLAADDVLDRTRGTGAYTLAAAGEFARAWFETDASIADPQTYFTKYLVDVIEGGIPGEGPQLRLEPIFHEAVEALARDGKPVPTSRATGHAPRLVFARNAAARSSGAAFEESGPELPDYSRSNAILIGTSTYQDTRFPPLPAAANSLNGLKQVLIEPGLCGWPPERITVLEDPTSTTRVIQQLRRLARQTQDALLVYYVGHATPLRQGQLCLTISDTEADDPDITGVEYERVREAILDSPARTKTVILDCDYAGRATADGASYLLSASDHATHEVPLDQQADACTSFTGELLEVIRTGIASGPENLTLSRIYPQLRRRLQLRDLPTPSQRSTDATDQSAFTRNAATPQGPVLATRPVKDPGRRATADQTVQALAALVHPQPADPEAGEKLELVERDVWVRAHRAGDGVLSHGPRSDGQHAAAAAKIPNLDEAFQTSSAKVRRTVLYIEQVNSTATTATVVSEAQLVTAAAYIYTTITRVINQIETLTEPFVKWLGGGALITFDAADATEAIKAAIRIQYAIKLANEGQTIDSLCSIGIASGGVFAFITLHGTHHHIGTVMDRCTWLSSAANANAIFIDHETVAMTNMTRIESPLGYRARQDACGVFRPARARYGRGPRTAPRVLRDLVGQAAVRRQEQVLERLALLGRMLTDDTGLLRTRVAATLVLLYAQPVSRIVRLTLDDVIHDDGQVLIRFGQAPSPVPEPFATLLLDYIAGRTNMRAATNPDSPWLFPGRRAGQPLRPEWLAKKITRMGVPTIAARGAAIRQHLRDSPAPIVADALGYNHPAGHRRTSGVGGPGTVLRLGQGHQRTAPTHLCRAAHGPGRHRLAAAAPGHARHRDREVRR